MVTSPRHRGPGDRVDRVASSFENADPSAPFKTRQRMPPPSVAGLVGPPDRKSIPPMAAPANTDDTPLRVPTGPIEAVGRWEQATGSSTRNSGSSVSWVVMLGPARSRAHDRDRPCLPVNQETGPGGPEKMPSRGGAPPHLCRQGKGQTKTTREFLPQRCRRP